MKNRLDQMTPGYLSGDPSAAAAIYSVMQQKLLLIAYHYCRNRESSQDIVQDVFEKLVGLTLERRNEYFGTEDGNIEAWLYVAVRHKAMDHQKIKANRERIDVSVRLIYRQDTLNIAFDKLSSDELVRMLDLLQPRQREILHLHIIGYRNEEIAEKLGITYNTVKNNIYEARLRLRKLWAVFME